MSSSVTKKRLTLVPRALVITSLLAITLASAPNRTFAQKALVPTSSVSAATAIAPCATPITTATGTIAVILQATAASPRWETQDRPRLLANLKRCAPNAKVLYSNAEGSSSNQLSLAEAAITKGAKVLMVAPVDGIAAGEIARQATAAGVKFIAYDALVLKAPVDAYVSFDNVGVGELMGQYIQAHTKTGDTIVMIGGSPQDNNAILFQQGALNVLQPLYNSKARVLGYRTLTPQWAQANAQREMEQALSKLNNNVQGVVVGNDNLALGVIAALRAQGLAGKVPVTGQDATASGLAQIIMGLQGMTVYKPIEKEAEAASILAAYFLGGITPPSGLLNGKVSNGSVSVPSILLQPISVSKSNIGSTVVKDGYWTWKTICDGVVRGVACPPM